MMWARRLLPFLLALHWALAGPVLAQTGARADKRELQARKEFAAGNYQRAVDLFAQLFAESGDPVFLRNIGRCYQKLGRPAEALESFRYYLERAPRLEPGERKEVEGFIAELRKQVDGQEGATAAPATSAPPATTAAPAT